MKKNHAIRTVRFDFEFERQSSAGTFLETIGNIFQTEIAPQIEKIFDRHDKTGGMLSLDNLELDLGAVEEEQLYDTLRMEIPRLLDKLLSGMEFGEETPESGILRLFGADSHQDIPFSMHTEQAYPLELIRIFLQTGLLPPSVSLERGALEKLIDEVLEREPEKLKELLSAKGQGIRPERLAWNLSPAQRLKIEALTGLSFPEWTEERGTADGGRRTGDGGRETADGGRRTGDEGRETADGEMGGADDARERGDGGRRTADGEMGGTDDARETADGRRRTADGEIGGADDVRETADGRRRTADGEIGRADDAQETRDGIRRTADEGRRTKDGEVGGEGIEEGGEGKINEEREEGKDKEEGGEKEEKISKGKKEEIRKDKTGKTSKRGETDKTSKTSETDKTSETGRKDGIETEKKQKRTPLEKKRESVQLDQLSEKELLGLVIAFLEKGTLPVFFQFKEAGQEEVLRAVEMLWKSRQLQFAEAILPFISFRKKGPPAYLALMQLLHEEWELLPEKQKRHPVFVQLKKKLGSPAKPYVPPATESSMPEEEGYFIKNAGLVILWPFMRHLFNALKLLDEKGKFLGEEQQFYAAHLLEYAATKNTVTPEYLMPFNKILCEIPFSTPLPPEIELGENAKELVESLLRAVIQQWSAIKNSSEDGLRGNFLIRDGKLVKKEKNWTLVVEQKSFDILLDRLPWGISTIKLPWMSPILYVEWR